MNRLAELRQFGAKGLALAVAVHAGSGAGFAAAYLPVVGPVSLRFEAIPAPAVAHASFALDALVAKQAAASAVPAKTTNATPLVAGATNNAALAVPGTGDVAEGTISATSATAIGGANPADTGLVSPQMLADFLKPAGRGTNAVLAVPTKVGFAPPSPPAENQSRAVYRSP